MLGSIAGIAAIVVSAAVAVLGVEGAASEVGGSSSVETLGVLLFVAATLSAGTFWLRRRLPIVALAGAAVIALPLQLDASAALLVGGSLLARWQSRWRWHAFAACAALVVVAVVRDTLRGPAGAVVAQLLDDALTTESVIVLNATIGGASLALALAYGLGTRSMLRSDRAVRAADELRELSSSLTEQLDHVDRRIELSQAMHDTVAKTLTHIGLRVGAMQSSDALPPHLQESAGEVARQVRQAMRELQEVQRAMESEGAGGAATAPLPEKGIHDIRGLVDEVRATGRRVDADLVVLGRTPLSLATDRTAYWMLSEALLNTQKHAGSDVRVALHADDAEGVRMTVENSLAQRPVDPTFSGGRGTEIMAGRALAVGGWARAGVEGDRYVLRAWLPWR